MVNIDERSLARVPELDHAPANPDPSSISPDAWEPFEAAALGVMGRIQPTVLSEARRAAVVDCVQRLVRLLRRLRGDTGYSIPTCSSYLRRMLCLTIPLFE
jgi:hypothetical protein